MAYILREITNGGSLWGVPVAGPRNQIIPFRLGLAVNIDTG